MWRAVVGGIVFQHALVVALVRDLNRNPALPSVYGFEPLPRQSPPVVRIDCDPVAGKARRIEAASPVVTTVPNAWNFARFLFNVIALEEEAGLVSGMVEELRVSLYETFPLQAQSPLV